MCVCHGPLVFTKAVSTACSPSESPPWPVPTPYIPGGVPTPGEPSPVSILPPSALSGLPPHPQPEQPHVCHVRTIPASSLGPVPSCKLFQETGELDAPWPCWPGLSPRCRWGETGAGVQALRQAGPVPTQVLCNTTFLPRLLSRLHSPGTHTLPRGRQSKLSSYPILQGESLQGGLLDPSSAETPASPSLRFPMPRALLTEQ